MSFITKRERVFNEYDLYDLPSRNEGKIKAYASCTDARAWSHFCSDKTEHLVEIIKRNNETCRPKYVPTDVIVNTLMGAKNAEISRLKRKIGEFEQMIAAYDQLELTCDQKCEIANAHAAIRAANKELDEMCLDLDLSGFTEGIDSEAFETGKSRGDDTGKSKGYETERSRGEDVSKNIHLLLTAYDTRLDDMQDTIIRKDAKLNAMQNKIAVMENDVCEPYCIYAHIYTALEKIFGTLCQNGKYKQYLNLLTAGKDTRCIDIKGKILYKMKVLEKFCLALIAPCSQEFSEHTSTHDCSCYRAEIIAHVEPALAIASTEPNKNHLDDRRAQLVADIIDNEEMKEILSKDSILAKNEQRDENYGFDSCSIDTESLNRLKNLQANYDELLTCYDNLKHEKDCLFLRCQKYNDLEKECECMQNRLREYKLLWAEKEHYRKRSEDLDTLKESYYVLSEETTNLETKLKAETEINKIKRNNITHLQSENVALEKKLQELNLAFETEKNSLMCKLKEYECNIMCQDQQIKSLSRQIDKFLEQGHEEASIGFSARSVELLNEIESQKEQIRNLSQALLCNEEEKQLLQEDFQTKLELINELKMELENIKDKSEKLLQTNICLEEYTRDYQKQIQHLRDQNKMLVQEIENKKSNVENLKEIVESKSQEINNLTNIVESKSNENLELLQQLNSNEENHNKKLALINYENETAIDSLKSAQRESYEVLAAFRNYLQKNEPTQLKPDGLPKDKGSDIYDEDGFSVHSNKSVLLNEIKKLHEISIHSLHSLLDENIRNKESLDVSRKESKILAKKVEDIEELRQKLKDLKHSHENLLKDNNTLQNELSYKKRELDDLINSFLLTKKESNDLLERLNKNENIKDEFLKLNALYQKLGNERNVLKNELQSKEKELQNLTNLLNCCKNENEKLLLENLRIQGLEAKLIELESEYRNLNTERERLQDMFDAKTEEMNNLYNNFELKIEENRHLFDKIEQLQVKKSDLKDENRNIQNNLMLVKKESAVLLRKVETDLDNLKHAYDTVNQEKQRLEMEIEAQKKQLQEINAENKILHNQKKELLVHSEDLENALIDARSALKEQSNSPKNYLNNVKEEIEAMKKEKILQQKNIRDLTDRLDESDIIISELREDISMRDSKIATLQNYVNELEEEVRHLNNNIAVAVESSEQILDSSHKKIDESLKILDAHHSKATHNMKMDLTKLKQEYSLLENQLSITKSQIEEVNKEKYKYMNDIRDLQDERDVMLQNIKELELVCAGDSDLSNGICTVNDILNSLNRIRKCVVVRSSKSTSLEQTLLTVQNSSRILLSKADEAKKIAENEKQKIAAEKEEAIKERLVMEKQLAILETKLEEQIAKDQELIKNLEAKLLNQKLMFEKINESSQIYIRKLETEILNLQDLYKNSLSKISELQEKSLSISEENNKKIEEIENVAKNLERKSKEITHLRKCIDDLKNKPMKCIDIQTDKFVSTVDISCQTYSNTSNKNDERNSFTTNNENFNIVGDDVEKPINEGSMSEVETSDTIMSEEKKDNINDIRQRHKIIDIYNTHSVFTHNTELSSKSPDMGSTFKLTNDTFLNENNRKDGKKLNKISSSGQATDNGLFLIYKDSDVNQSDFDKKSWPNQIQSKLVVEAATIENKMNVKANTKTSYPSNDQATYNPEIDSNQDDDSVKPKLTLSLPRVYTDSLSKATNSESDKKSLSLDSYTLAIYASQKYTHSDMDLNDSYSSDHKKAKYLRDLSENNKIRTEDKIDDINHIINNELIKPESLKQYKNANKKQISSHGKDKSMLSALIDKQNKDDIKKYQDSEKHRMPNVSTHQNNKKNHKQGSNYGLKYILDSVPKGVNNFKIKSNSMRRSQSDDNLFFAKDYISERSGSRSLSPLLRSFTDYRATSKDVSKTSKNGPSSFSIEQGVLAKLDNIQEYESKIKELTTTLDNIEKHYKMKIEAVKAQYDNNIKNIINEHNQGVVSIQSLHEETLNDVIKSHESEIENLRSMSIEAMRKVELLEKENTRYKLKLHEQHPNDSNEEPIKMSSPEMRKRKHRRSETRMLTKTNIEAFNVRPKPRSHGPCTCTLDSNISDTIRNIFEQVDVDQRRMAEHAYIKYIANKIINKNVEGLDAQELAFLHLKVCRTWKTMLSKEEVLKKRIDSLESELINKQRQTQKHIAELDRKVAEERRRLQEVREAVCRNTPADSRESSPQSHLPVPEKDVCKCYSTSCNTDVEERLSAGDLQLGVAACTLRPKRQKQESNRYCVFLQAVSAKLDSNGRKNRKHYHDEQPIRLRQSQDRPTKGGHKK
ncbi:interaptin-like [Zerene cesonia]|uniref:interaptin-like n=1 Tax=Zerene cesonia TaxID=33412 RepID=UPI0018E58D60|nr:interaptin-like [Zerene cesonia]